MAMLTPRREKADLTAWLAVAAGTLGALMATLDISIVNSALHHSGRDRRIGHRGHMGRHLLSGGRDRHHPAGRMVSAGAGSAHLPADRGQPVHAVLGGLRHGGTRPR
jgi:hypothetical protein